MTARSEHSRRSFLKASGGTVATAVATLAAPRLIRAAPLKRFTFVANYFARGDYAEYYLALARGYYAKHGLDVTIRHVLGNALAFQALAGNQADAVYADIIQMLELQGKSPDPQLLLVADIVDKLPLSFFFLKGHGIVQPKDLEGRTIADSPGSTTPFIFKLFAEKNGIDPKKVKWFFTTATNKTTMMLEGKADAVATDLPARASLKARARPGQEIGHVMFSDYGVDIYGTGLITRESYWRTHKETTEAFVEATIEGCYDAFADPAAAVDALRKHHPEVDRATGIGEEKLMAEVCLTPEQRKHGIGYIDPAKMQRTYDVVVHLLRQPIAKPVTAYYTAAALPPASFYVNFSSEGYAPG